MKIRQSAKTARGPGKPGASCCFTSFTGTVGMFELEAGNKCRHRFLTMADLYSPRHLYTFDNPATHKKHYTNPESVNGTIKIPTPAPLQ
jgi:hypothetical protein